MNYQPPLVEHNLLSGQVKEVCYPEMRVRKKDVLCVRPEFEMNVTDAKPKGAKKDKSAKERIRKKVWRKNRNGLYAWKYELVPIVTTNRAENITEQEHGPPSVVENGNAPAIELNISEYTQTKTKPGSCLNKRNLFEDNRAGKERESARKRLKFT